MLQLGQEIPQPVLQPRSGWRQEFGPPWVEGQRQYLRCGFAIRQAEQEHRQRQTRSVCSTLSFATVLFLNGNWSASSENVIHFRFRRLSGGIFVGSCVRMDASFFAW